MSITNIFFMFAERGKKLHTSEKNKQKTNKQTTKKSILIMPAATINGTFKFEMAEVSKCHNFFLFNFCKIPK